MPQSTLELLTVSGRVSLVSQNFECGPVGARLVERMSAPPLSLPPRMVLSDLDAGEVVASCHREPLAEDRGRLVPARRSGKVDRRSRSRGRGTHGNGKKTTPARPTPHPSS